MSSSHFFVLSSTKLKIRMLVCNNNCLKKGHAHCVVYFSCPKRSDWETRVVYQSCTSCGRRRWCSRRWGREGGPSTGCTGESASSTPSCSSSLPGIARGWTKYSESFEQCFWQYRDQCPESSGHLLRSLVPTIWGPLPPLKVEFCRNIRLNNVVSSGLFITYLVSFPPMSFPLMNHLKICLSDIWR